LSKKQIQARCSGGAHCNPTYVQGGDGRIVVRSQPGQKNHQSDSISKNKPGMVVHSCNPATWEAQVGRLQASPGQKCETLSEKP
jgi:hypothetical protein